MKKPAIHATDHAVCQYLERALGVDIEGLRRRIGRAASLAVEHEAAAVSRDGVRFVVSNGRVVTVTLTGARARRRGRDMGGGGR